MDSFSSYIFRKAYQKIQKLGDRLAEIEPLIEWEAFRPIIQGLYDNQGPKGGRPNVDEVVMVKMLVLQSWYGLSDPELERQANDRISFHRFLGFPDVIPDATTVWLFRERLAETGKDKLVWAELQRQLDEKGLRVKKGVVQDATFITSDPGKHGKPRGEEADPPEQGRIVGEEGQQVILWVQAARQDGCRPWPHQGSGDDHRLGARQPGGSVAAG